MWHPWTKMNGALVRLVHQKKFFFSRQEQRQESDFKVVEILWKIDHGVKAIFMHRPIISNASC